jgi:cytochrome c556
MRSLFKPGLAKLGLVTFCALASISAVQAQDAPAAGSDEALQKAVETRQAVFKLIGWNSDFVMAMLKNKAPFDAPTAQKVADRVAALAPMIPDAFATDTRKAASVKTKAREGIWTNMADFKAKSDDLVKAAQALSAAAKTGDKAATMKATTGVGKACSGCHDNYRDK